jgi:hypothetical protein
MESTPTPAEAAAALEDADASRSGLARRIETPSWFFTSMAVAVAVQIGTAAYGLGAGTLWVVIAGALVFLAVAGVQLARFRALNGVWLGGFASRVVFGSGNGASASYAVSAAAAIWAGFEELWWLAALWACIGGAAYALAGRRWMRTYRADPAAHGRGESAVWLALLLAAALAALALLLTNA